MQYNVWETPQISCTCLTKLGNIYWLVPRWLCINPWFYRILNMEMYFCGTVIQSLTKLQRMQNRCLRTVLRKDRLYSTELLHSDAKVATWRKRALTSAIKLIFKYKFDANNMVDRDLNRWTITRSQEDPLFKIDFPRKSLTIYISFHSSYCHIVLFPGYID